MSSAKLKEMREKEDKELVLDLANLRKELFDLRFQSMTEKLSSPARISQIKKEVARTNTLLRERAAGSNQESND